MEKWFNVINSIVVICVLLFAATLYIPGYTDSMIDLLALHFPMNGKFRIWQLLTHIFMHGSFMHILFNMYALVMFGRPFEFIWGKLRFLIFFITCGVGAGIISLLIDFYKFNRIDNQLIKAGLSESDIYKILETGTYSSNILSSISKDTLTQFYQVFHSSAVGASGALYGILVAFAFTFPREKLALIFLPFPVAAKYFIPVLISIDLFSGITGFSIFGQGIGHFAHVGGAFIGFIFMLFWRGKKFEINRVGES